MDLFRIIIFITPENLVFVLNCAYFFALSSLQIVRQKAQRNAKKISQPIAKKNAIAWKP